MSALGLVNAFFSVSISFCFVTSMMICLFKVFRRETLNGSSIAITGKSFLFLAASIITLLRGAPHNNLLVYSSFENWGAAGPVICVLIIFIAALLLVAARGNQVQIAFQWLCGKPRLAVCICALFAILSSLEPVIQNWDVPGWGDAIFWDRIAHTIARGDAPLGYDYYMPVYQYGTAALYKIFGHFFWVQQVANVLWAPVTIIALALAAKNLSGNNWAAIAIASIAATQDYLRYEAQIQQIENWYIPIVALAIWASSRCFKMSTPGSAALLGFAAAIAFETRTQGAFFHAFLLLSPLFNINVVKLQRAKLTVISIVVFCACLTPWTLRNVVSDGRVSPVGTQGGIHLALSLHPDSFHGIRRNLVPQEWKDQWSSNDGNTEQTQEQFSYVVDRLSEDPGYYLRGIWWHSVAFWGLLPEGVWEPNGPQATDWAVKAPKWLMGNSAILLLLSSFLVSSFLVPKEKFLFLVGAVTSSMAVVFFAGFTEARIHYPVLPILYLGIILGMFENKELTERTALTRKTYRTRNFGMLACIATIFVGSYYTLGRNNLYRNITEPDITMATYSRVTKVLEENELEVRSKEQLLAAGMQGKTFRARLATTNHHLPVKWYAPTISGFPDHTVSPEGPVYFRAYLVEPNTNGYYWGTSYQISLSIAEMLASQTPKEDDIWDIAAEVVDISPNGTIIAKAIAGNYVSRAEALDLVTKK